MTNKQETMDRINFAIVKQKEKCIEEFIRELEYIETIKSYNNVFDRITKVKEKWEKQ